MKPIQKHDFLIDENVNIRVKSILQDYGISAQTIKDLNYLGLKDNAVISYIQEYDLVLLTHDRDFLYRWRVENLKILLLRIHPTIFSKIRPLLDSFLSSSTKLLGVSFLIELTNSGIIYHN